MKRAKSLYSVEEQWLLTRKVSYLINQNVLNRYSSQLDCWLILSNREDEQFSEVLKMWSGGCMDKILINSSPDKNNSYFTFSFS